MATAGGSAAIERWITSLSASIVNAPGPRRNFSCCRRESARVIAGVATRCRCCRGSILFRRPVKLHAGDGGGTSRRSSLEEEGQHRNLYRKKICAGRLDISRALRSLHATTKLHTTMFADNNQRLEIARPDYRIGIVSNVQLSTQVISPDPMIMGLTQ